MMQIISCSSPKSPPTFRISIHKMGLTIIQTGGPFIFLGFLILLAGKGGPFTRQPAAAQ